MNLKVVKKEEKYWNDSLKKYEKKIYSKVLNVDTNEYVESDIIHAVTYGDFVDEGLRIVKVDGECKAIIKWEREIFIRGGKLVADCNEKSSTDKILSNAKLVTVFNTDGKELFEARRVIDDDHYITFKIIFGKNTITCLEMEVETDIMEVEQADGYILYKKVYNYDGKKLNSKKRIVTYEELINKASKDDEELSK